MQTYLQQSNQSTENPQQPSNPVIYTTLSLMQLVHGSTGPMRAYIKLLARQKAASTGWKVLYSGSTLTLSKSFKLQQLLERSSGSLTIACSSQTKHGHPQTKTVFQTTLERIKREKHPFSLTHLWGNPQWGRENQCLCFYTEIPRKEEWGNNYNEKPRNGLFKLNRNRSFSSLS